MAFVHLAVGAGECDIVLVYSFQCRNFDSTSLMVHVVGAAAHNRKYSIPAPDSDDMVAASMIDIAAIVVDDYCYYSKLHHLSEGYYDTVLHDGWKLCRCCWYHTMFHSDHSYHISVGSRTGWLSQSFASNVPDPYQT